MMHFTLPTFGSTPFSGLWRFDHAYFLPPNRFPTASVVFEVASFVAAF